jgi:long-chain acyl-CoA synthetase
MTQPTQAPLPSAAGSAPLANAADRVPSQAANHAPNTDGIWYASYPADVPHEIDVNQYESLVQFFDECIAQFRERVAYVSVGANMTYGELGRKATAFAAYLQSIGVKSGERVAIMLPNTFQYPVSLFGVLKAGGVVVNVNPLYTVRELAHQLKDSGAQTIIVFENFAKTVEDALPGTKVQNVIVTGLGDLLADGLNLKGRLLNFMLRHVKKMVPKYNLPKAVPLLDALSIGYTRPLTPVRPTHNDIAFLQYTGGTTGVAKGAMLTHKNIIANLLQAKAWSEGQLSGDIETVLTPLPLYHIYSLTVNALIFMGLGGRNILIANPRDMKRVMMIIRHEKFTGMTAVNTLYNAFLDNEEFCKRDFSNLKLAMAGGMATQKSVADRFKAVTGKPDHRRLWADRMLADRLDESGGPDQSARLRRLDWFARAVHASALQERRRYVGEHRRSRRTVRERATGNERLLESPRRNRQGDRRRWLARHRRHRRDGFTRLYPPDRPQEGHDSGVRLQRLSERSRGRDRDAPGRARSRCNRRA